MTRPTRPAPLPPTPHLRVADPLPVDPDRGGPFYRLTVTCDCGEHRTDTGVATGQEQESLAYLLAMLELTHRHPAPNSRRPWLKRRRF